MPALRAALALVLAAVCVSAQTTILVPGQQPTIQAGISVAVNGDTVLVAPGTYFEQIDFVGKLITVRSSGGAAVTTIDSQGAANWFDFPFGAVVRMTQGEGPFAVLEGFTVTGGKSSFGQGGYSGVHCVGLTPTIRDCVITGNSGGTGGGVMGDALLARCTIVGNDSLPYGDGGGVWGAPMISDCVVSGNASGGLGGGIYASGPCVITRTVIDSNVAGNGFDGYSGGGVFGPATLADCQITRNTANHWLSGGPPDEIGTAVDGAVSISGCTITGNLVGNPQAGDPAGALRNVGTVVDSILWGNQLAPVSASSAPTITYSIVTGGWAGLGNLTSDPLFANPLTGDYFLSLGSPAIDAGDPASALDPDGTRRDMGSLPFPQFPAGVTPRNGSGVNPLAFSAANTPKIGTTLGTLVDAALAGQPTGLTLVYAFVLPSAPLPLPWGELLVDPTSPLLFTSALPASAGVATHPLPIPADHSLGGLIVPAQAAVVGASIVLTNALDLTLGV